MADDSTLVTDGVVFECPYCGAQCTVSDQQRLVLHAVPFCDRFQEMDANEFVNEAMKRRVLH